MKHFKYVIGATILTLIGCNNSNTNNGQENTTKKNDVDICKCLTEPGNSEYMTQNGTACDEAISKEIGVADWKKVNMKYDKATSKKFEDLVYKCTGQRPNVEISGTFSGTDNVGMESTIILRKGGSMILHSSIGDGTPSVGHWEGDTENLSLYIERDEPYYDNYGTLRLRGSQLLGRARITEEGLQIIGGKFYRRQ